MMQMKTFNRLFKGSIPGALLGLMLVLPAHSFAQNDSDQNMMTITGIVKDAATNSPLQGVRVQAYNNILYSAMTREDGSYAISVPKHITSLIFALEGCTDAVAPIAGGVTTADMLMYSDVFSPIYSKYLSGDKSKTMGVSANTMDISIDNQIEDKLQGDILATSRSGHLGVGVNMLLNGINSLNVNTQPLIVLDGVILDMQYTRETFHDGYYNNLLANIMVNDIESVEVLKNGLAVYGSKGANGVILINTKRNSGKSMATRIDVSAGAAYQMLPTLPSMMSADQYRAYASEMIGGTGTKLTEFKFLKSDPDYYYYKTYHNETDWTKETYKEAFLQQYSINVLGGDDIADYSLSVGYTFGNSVLKKNDFKRFNLRLNSDVKLGKRISIRFDASYSDVTRDLRDDGVKDDVDDGLISSPGFLSLIKSPFLSPYEYDVNGNLSQYLAQEDNYLDELLASSADLGRNNGSLPNPVAFLTYGESVNKNYFGSRMINLAVTPKIQINRFWTVNEHFSFSLFSVDENYFTPLNGTPSYEIETIGTVQNLSGAQNSQQLSFFSNTYTEYTRRFKQHDMSLKAGFRYMKNSFKETSMWGYNSGNDKTPNMNKDLANKSTDGVDDTDISLTWWFQGNYNFRERYYLTVGLGVSSSSRFGGKVSNGLQMCGVPWGIFPSASASWVLTSEPWFKQNKAVNFMKLNLGYDLTGNDGFDDTAARTYFSPVKILGVTGTALANIGNSSLQWETTSRLTAGLDMSFINNRLFLSANFYKSNTNNLLATSALSYLTGIEESWTNDGALKNQGFDVSLNAKLVNRNLFKWELGASVGAYQMEISSLPGGHKDFTYYGATVRVEEGSAPYFYGYKTNGVFATSAGAQSSNLGIKAQNGAKIPFTAGDVIFEDLNNDGFIDESDMTKIGMAQPKLYGAIQTKFTIQNFTLSASFGYRLGGDIYNYQRSILESGSRFMNQTVALTNRWVAEGQVTDVPKASYGDPMGNARFSDRWIEDGSFLRLRNVTLSYKIPVYNAFIKGLSVWVAGNNLLTLTNYLGSDPEFSYSNNALTNGIDRGLLPNGRSVTFGLKLNL